MCTVSPSAGTNGSTERVIVLNSRNSDIDSRAGRFVNARDLAWGGQQNVKVLLTGRALGDARVHWPARAQNSAGQCEHAVHRMTDESLFPRGDDDGVTVST